MRPALRLINSPAPGSIYAIGFSDGMAHGERCTSVRWFWFGLLAGSVLATYRALAIIHFGGF